MNEHPARQIGSRGETRDPCAVCGWAKHMGIHQPVVSGARLGQPWGHAYVDPEPIRSVSKPSRSGRAG